MKIKGIGVDIVQNSRFNKLVKDNKFIERIFSKKEITHSKKIINKVTFYAKRFAAKEAFAKSMGTGIRNGLNFRDISIHNDKMGKPYFYINSYLKKKFNINSTNFHLSISDENKYCIAFVIFQK